MQGRKSFILHCTQNITLKSSPKIFYHTSHRYPKLSIAGVGRFLQVPASAALLLQIMGIWKYGVGMFSSDITS